jgi:branched-chain amino acid aminotransferase
MEVFMSSSRPTSDRPKFAIMNGETVPFGDAKISIMAPGLTFAVTVFEGMRAYWSSALEQLLIFRLDDHIKRQSFSAKLIELDASPTGDETRRHVIEVLRANAMREDCYVRTQLFVDDWGDMTATGPTSSSVVCRARPRVDAFDAGKHFVVVSWRRNMDDTSPPRIKASANYLNSRLAGLEAKRVGAGGAIILNRSGTVSEGPGGCIFICRDDKLITPSVTDGILESITRDTLLRLAEDMGIETEERSIDRTELYLASEAFYCGTGQEITPMVSVDGKPVGDGRPGPRTRELQLAYDHLVRGGNARYEHWLTPVWPA